MSKMMKFGKDSEHEILFKCQKINQKTKFILIVLKVDYLNYSYLHILFALHTLIESEILEAESRNPGFKKALQVILMFV